MKTYEIQVIYEARVDAESEEEAIQLAEIQFCLEIDYSPTSKAFVYEVVDKYDVEEIIT